MRLGNHDGRLGHTPLMIGLIASAGILGRIIPHAPNATPMAALGLIAGSLIGGRAAIAIPLAILAITDLAIGTYSPVVMIAVYACMIVPGLLGMTLLKHSRNPLRIAACAAASSALFFLVTNFAVWSAGGWYADNFAGLMACYAAALPFARNMLAGDLVWSAAMFAGLALMENRSAIAKTAVAEA
ncbi:MAG: hypothetical protein NT172_12300 [Planctomycetota bacterium]|nr:hypothetical protein [Planctomycetota bacterium]